MEGTGNGARMAVDECFFLYLNHLFFLFVLSSPLRPGEWLLLKDYSIQDFIYSNFSQKLELLSEKL